MRIGRCEIGDIFHRSIFRDSLQYIHQLDNRPWRLSAPTAEEGFLNSWRLTMLSEEFFLAVGLLLGAALGVVACLYT